MLQVAESKHQEMGMPRDGTATRVAIMDAAEALILEKGYAGTSIDQVIAQAGITKGAFFYHFESKAALALQLVERFAANDLALFAEQRARAEKLSRDPLQQTLIMIGLYKEMMEQLTEPYPGCLFASYLYEADLFDDRIMAVIDATYRTWRTELGAIFDNIAERYPPRLPIDTAQLADLYTGMFEGAFILSKTLKEPQLVAQQVGLYRDFVELLFSPEPGAPTE